MHLKLVFGLSARVRTALLLWRAAAGCRLADRDGEITSALCGRFVYTSSYMNTRKLRCSAAAAVVVFMPRDSLRAAHIHKHARAHTDACMHGWRLCAANIRRAPRGPPSACRRVRLGPPTLTTSLPSSSSHSAQLGIVFRVLCHPKTLYSNDGIML